MYRRSQTNREIKLLRESVDPNHGPSTFDDEENVIVTVLIALHDHILANTASTGPTMDAKNRVWDIIRERLCNRVGAIQRTDEQVRNRWRSLRSSYAFKQDKARHLAEMFYKRLGQNHNIHLEDISAPGIKFPQWLTNMIKNDPKLKLGSGNNKNLSVKKREITTTAGVSSSANNSQQQRRSSLLIGKNANNVVDEPPAKRRKTTMPKLPNEPNLIDQEADNFIYKKIIFPVKDEDSSEAVEESKTSNTPPSSVTGHEELNSVTESGANTPIVNDADEYETELQANYRRREEIHQAQLALLNAKKKEVNMRMKLTELQIQAFLRQNSAVFEIVDENLSTENAELVAQQNDEENSFQEKNESNEEVFAPKNVVMGEAEIPNGPSASEPIDTATDNDGFELQL